MKGLQRSLSRGPKATARIVKETILLKDFIVNVAAAGVGIGFGGSSVFQFPEGNISLLSAVLDAVMTESSGNISDTASGDLSVGSTAPDDGTLTGTDVDILPSTAWGAMVASAFTAAGNTITDAFLDFTAAPQDIFLNVLVDAADITDATNGDIVFNGTLTISYQVMGDN